MEAMQIIAAADGSSLGNPGPAGWAWFVDADTWRAGGWPRGTNNQGELMAVVDLLESTAEMDADLRILCDSQYVINCVTKWMPGWKRKGWKKADGKPVQNRDLLERIDAAMRGRRVEFEWVRGHAGHELNEAADLRARGVAEAFQRGSAPDEGPGFGARAGTAVADADERTTDADGAPVSTAPDAGRSATAAGVGASEEDGAALFDDGLFDAGLFDEGLVDGEFDAEAAAHHEALGAVLDLERRDARTRRDDGFRQLGTAVEGVATNLDARQLAPGVALVTSTVDGVDRTSIWVQRADRHQAEWLLVHRHDG